MDRATQEWVRLTGRKVLLADHPWLVGPVGDVGEVADGWVASEAARWAGTGKTMRNKRSPTLHLEVDSVSGEYPIALCHGGSLNDGSSSCRERHTKPSLGYGTRS